jgi:Predicted membrane protein
MRAIKAILERNLINFTRDKMRLFFTIFMSVFFLFIFSYVMKSAAGSIENPMNYLISGVIIMTIFQGALNNSMGILEDISNGYMKEILVAPIARWQISIGQILSATVISSLQGLIVIVMGLFMGLNVDVVHFIEMIVVMLLVGITFSSIGLFLATLSRNSSTFQLIITVISMPLTFLSGAYIPTIVIPSFLKPIIYINPLTYTTAAFRYIALKMEGMSTVMLLKTGVAFKVLGVTVLPYMGLIMIIAVGFLFFALCVNRFNKADFSTVKTFHHHG